MSEATGIAVSFAKPDPHSHSAIGNRHFPYSWITISFLASTFPPNGPRSAVTTTVNVPWSTSGSVRLLGIFHEYPQLPPQPYSMEPLATSIPSESRMRTFCPGRVPCGAMLL